MRAPRLTLVGVAILALSAVAGVVLLPVLPSSVAIHFGGGDPDSFVAAPLGVLLVPTIGIGALLVTRFAGATAIGNSVPPVFDSVLATFLAYVQALVLAYNLGARFDMLVAVVPAVVTFGVVAVVLDRAGREDKA
ncbi:DUF1648 domain-containing protein [Haloferax sulfurifontis]|uniref:DUF1648 domain-containing protein n=1 Tax=Haloferax sulfurifontis TaxID=255616 RepID=A0A830DT55_9EURY|nr:DUF1648 domain-containing protein [Haloferax sulfurifontis]GGC58526.1 hypothetical protein GCM10007209_20570 [Haloferax sulfurifontis]